MTSIIAPNHRHPAVRDDLHPVLALRANSCRWPVGEPGKEGFHFCADAVEPGRPYCLHHHALAVRQQ
ncbi:hypothetical protein JQ543_28240 [Bradyrhizobium diazoefficiens]|nr:hypothetical protein [Bradyrhizobium diazoefficiens]MBR0851661.1 hypothetical protein [Bradyrhizobium diazoefficiens]